MATWRVSIDLQRRNALVWKCREYFWPPGLFVGRLSKQLRVCDDAFVPTKAPDCFRLRDQQYAAYPASRPRLLLCWCRSNQCCQVEQLFSSMDASGHA